MLWRMPIAITIASAITSGVLGQSVCSLDIGLGGFAEPSIAVNPNDPDNIAVAFIASEPTIECFVTVSTDGGLTWTDPAPTVFPPSYGDPSFEPFTKGDPVVAFDSSGRLFWSYLAGHAGEPCDCVDECVCEGEPTFCSDIVVVQVDRMTGMTIGDAVPVTGSRLSDKQWMAADTNLGSPYRDRLYMVWVENLHWCLNDNTPGAPRPVIHTSYSDTSGATWSSPFPVQTPPPPPPLEIVVHPAHVAVAGNGDVYIAHWQMEEGVSTGHVRVYRSDTGGAGPDPWEPLDDPFSPGEADGTVFNCPSERIPGTQFRMYVTHQPWILADPADPTRLYVVAYDDPDGVPGLGDDGDVMIARWDAGNETWEDPVRVDHAPGNAFSVFPTAAISSMGDIAVMWYDNRFGQMNQGGNFVLDLFFTVSTDHGLTFRPDHRLNDSAFDPDFGALPGICEGEPLTNAGDYIGITFAGCDLVGAWTGNDETGLQILVGEAFDQCGACPWDTDGDNNVSTADLLALLVAWGSDPCGPPDADGNGVVGTSDLLELLAHWGLCGAASQGPPQTVQDCIDRFGFEDPVVLEQCICGVEPTTEGCP